MKYISIRNFEKYQHYKDRRPPWIKLYNDLLDDYDYRQLPDESKSHLLGLFLLASRNDNKIPLNSDFIREQLGAKSDVNIRLLKKFVLVSKGRNASTTIAERKQSDELERETETYSKETETDNVSLVLSYLNEKTERSYQETETNRTLIGARLKTNSVDDCRAVIDKKVAEWRGTDMDRYLRPATLFNETKFDAYMNENGNGSAPRRPLSEILKEAEQSG